MHQLRVKVMILRTDFTRKYHMQILLEDFNAKLWREVVFKTTVGYDSLHDIINDNRLGVVNVITPRNSVFKCTILPHHNIHKCTWTSLNRKTHNQIASR